MPGPACVDDRRERPAFLLVEWLEPYGYREVEPLMKTTYERGIEAGKRGLVPFLCPRNGGD